MKKSPLYDFMPIAVETLGAVGESTLDVVDEVRRRIASMTAEPRAFAFPTQCFINRSLYNVAMMSPAW